MSRSRYEAARLAVRRRSIVTARAECAWCTWPFVYQRHIGRPRLYCSDRCRLSAHVSQNRDST